MPTVRKLTPADIAPGRNEGKEYTAMPRFQLTRSYMQGNLQCREYIAMDNGEPVDRFSVFRERGGLGAWCAWTADTFSARRIALRRSFAYHLTSSGA